MGKVFRRWLSIQIFKNIEKSIFLYMHIFSSILLRSVLLVWRSPGHRDCRKHLQTPTAKFSPSISSFELSDFEIRLSAVTFGRFDTTAKLDAGGKPSTWFPPGRLVEHIKQTKRQIITVNTFMMKKSYRKSHVISNGTIFLVGFGVWEWLVEHISIRYVSSESNTASGAS